MSAYTVVGFGKILIYVDRVVKFQLAVPVRFRLLLRLHVTSCSNVTGVDVTCWCLYDLSIIHDVFSRLFFHNWVS